MSISRRRSAEGLQAVEPSSDPVVVSGPQCKFDHYRKTSLDSPHPYNLTLPESYNNSPLESDMTLKDYSKAPGYSDKEIQGPEDSKQARSGRICGLRRRVFMWVVVAIILLCVIGVVLGGVLGTQLGGADEAVEDDGRTDDYNTSATDGPSFQVRDKTGVAMVNPRGSSTLYAYYMDAAGMILESTYENGTWDQLHLVDAQAKITKNVTGEAPPFTPLAAVSFTVNETAYRQLFWFDTDGILTTMNHTETQNWTPPYKLLPDQPSLPATMALSACADTSTTGLNGIRIYFGSAETSTIQEVGLDFTATHEGWTNMTAFRGSDPASGAACTITDDNINLYFRNETNGALQQWSTAYTESGDWSIGPSTSPSTHPVSSTGSISAASNIHSTDYIFFHSTTTHILTAFYTTTINDSPSSSSITIPKTPIESLQNSPIGYHLTATWAPDSGGNDVAVVLCQHATIYSDLYFSNVQRDGSSHEAVTETGR